MTRGGACPGSRNAPLSFAVHDAARADLLAPAHPGRRAHRRLPRARPHQGGRPGGGRVHLRDGRRQPPARRHGGRPRRGRARRGHRRPTGPDAGHGRQPDHRPGRPLRRLRRDDGLDVDRRSASCCPGSRGPVHLNVQLDEPLVPEDAWTDLAATPPGGGRCREEPRRARRAPGRSPHRRGGRRRRGPAGAGAGPGRRLAAAGRADERLAHRRPRHPHLPPAAGQRPRRPHRAGRRRRPPDAVPPGHPAARRARTSRSSRCARGASGRRGRSRSSQEADRYVATPGDPAWLDEWREADRSVGRQLDRLLAAEPDLTPYEVAGAVEPRTAARAGCCTSAPPARSATWT